ncbi:MAG TPA: hypothetical protein VFP65_04155 [Anaeromyxobacteraceae bacterium]|nr:hypothetical protein [Anaeromyxobacteraceae bacterium]
MPDAILIVRRDDELLWAMRDALELEGYDVHVAADAAAAMSVLAGGLHPRAILMDAESVDAAAGEALGMAADGAPCLVTTWDARATAPRGARVLRQPFLLAELRAALAEMADAPRSGGPRRAGSG